MSAKRVLITARKPKSSRAHGAGSPEEPQPKLSPATSIDAPFAADEFKGKSGRGRPSLSRRQSAKRCSPSPRRETVLRNRAGMIWSVSTFDAGRTTHREVSVGNGRMNVAGQDA